ncbi:hypothetical protein CCP3SC15_4570004 [Gammaproteobacteria bacterium]
MVFKGNLATIIRPCNCNPNWVLVRIDKPAAGSHYKVGDYTIWDAQ